jgi:flagellar protein FlaG
MNIGPLPAAGWAEPLAGPSSAAFEQAARNRELAEAVRTLNENAATGPGSELRFAVDRETGRTLIRVVDRVTNEVLNQIPPEQVIRLAARMGGSSRGTRVG